jgi:hypothetical protein
MVRAHSGNAQQILLVALAIGQLSAQVVRLDG